jgi:two-component system, NarL family, response regulator LiaR
MLAHSMSWHQFCNKGLRALLRIWPEIELVGEAANGRDAVRLVVECRPEIVLMDLLRQERNYL